MEEFPRRAKLTHHRLRRRSPLPFREGLEIFYTLKKFRIDVKTPFSHLDSDKNAPSVP